MKDPLDDYLTFAKNLANKAGNIMLEHFTIGVAAELKPEAGFSPVTVADKTINSLVIEMVNAAYPDHAVIGEEESYVREDAPFSWVCDPIDGTIPYMLGVPTNVFSLALVDSEGQPVVAVVNDPYMKRLYWAKKGSGAFVNETPIRVNEVAKLSDAYVGVSGSHLKGLDTFAFKAGIFEASHKPFVVHSTIYEAMLVASGQIAATVYMAPNAHDVATSKLIIEEAGGKVTDADGNEQRYDGKVNGAFMSNCVIHEQLLAYAERHKL